MQMGKSPGLYGLTEKNSSRQGEELWGKNQFNSTFPVALCLYMRDQGKAPVSIAAKEGKIKPVHNKWEMADIVDAKSAAPFYNFEKSFAPYDEYSRNQADKIDLVISHGGQDTVPLEIKLTVTPDNGTADRELECWAPELVVRPVTSAYAMMGVARRIIEGKPDLLAAATMVLRKAYNRISSWDNVTEIVENSKALRGALHEVLHIAEDAQAPFLIQPIWKTEGQSLKLSEHCFDVFVWSDVAIMRIPANEHKDGKVMTRWLREIARHVRSLYDIIQTGDYDYVGIYKGMPLGKQNDKAFALSGIKSIKYMRHPRLAEPLIPLKAIDSIILNKGEDELKPERRFDAAAQAYLQLRTATLANKGEDA